MKNLVFSSVGDNTNFDNIWLGEDREYDVFVIYYGGNEKNFQKYSKKVDYIEKRKGDKWQNFHHLYTTQYNKIQEYDRIFFLDDDIIISTKDINKMFKTSLECDLWVCQPSFAKGSELGWKINISNPDYFLKYTNFVENNSCLMTKDSINRFMKMYDPKLISFGVDFIYMVANGVTDSENKKKFAIIDSIQCINPPGRIKSNKIKNRTVKSFQTQYKDISKEYWPNNDVTNSKTNSREFAKLKDHDKRRELFFEWCKKHNFKPYQPKVTQPVLNKTQRIEHSKSNYSTFIDIPFTKSLKEEKSNEPKIAILFLTRNNLKQPKLWYDYLNDGAGKCNVYAHTKERDKLNQQFLIDAQIPEHVNTEWGDANLLTATNLMIKNALKDPTNQFFILVSESCIPVYQFDVHYNLLVNQMKKSFLFTSITPKINPTGDNKQRDDVMYQLSTPEKLNITWENVTRNSQWMILNRKHAEIIDKHNHEDMWKGFNVADEWYHYNVIKYYDPNMKDNVVELVKPTYFSYRGLDTPEKLLSLTKEDIKNIQANPVAHPTEYDNVEKIIKLRDDNLSLFLRKITPNLKIKYEDLKLPS